MTMRVLIPALPSRTLAPHGGQRDHREREDVINANQALGEAAYHAVLDTLGPDHESHAGRITVTLTLRAAHGAKGQCPRCRALPKCDCYRPRSPSNFSGDICTAVLDGALRRHGIIATTTYAEIEEVRMRVEHVPTLEDEGIMVEVTE